MSHYVDGRREASGPVAFKALGPGRTSIGVRQNRVSWFKGRIREVRFTPGVVFQLWPEGVPGGKPNAGEERLEDGRIYHVHNPTLTYVPPVDGTPNGTAMIVCPGGGYARLAISNEADGAARVLGRMGISTFILKYRLAEYGYPAPLQDVLRAVRLVRSRAAEFGIRPDRIGVFGASAGGHVAGMAATLFDHPDGRTGAPLDAMSARPDFIALLYPVISMTKASAHSGSRKNLVGERPPVALVEQLSLETRVTKEAPPAFLVHTTEDRSVPHENSVLFFQALRSAGVPAEMHLYEHGSHGFGFSPDLGPTSEWPRRLEEWMRANGWLAP
jgi:acetyl esterase/lipase